MKVIDSVRLGDAIFDRIEKPLFKVTVPMTIADATLLGLPLNLFASEGPERLFLDKQRATIGVYSHRWGKQHTNQLVGSKPQTG